MRHSTQQTMTATLLRFRQPWTSTWTNSWSASCAASKDNWHLCKMSTIRKTAVISNLPAPTVVLDLPVVLFRLSATFWSTPVEGTTEDETSHQSRNWYKAVHTGSSHCWTCICYEPWYRSWVRGPVWGDNIVNACTEVYLGIKKCGNIKERKGKTKTAYAVQ